MEFWLRVSGWVFVVLCLGTGVVMGLGGRLPEHQKTMVSGEVRASQAEVWTALADVENLPRWQSGFRAVSPLPDRGGLPCWREARRFVSLRVCVTEEHEPTRWVVSVVDPKSPLQETWTYEMRPMAGGTEVRVGEDVSVGPAMWRFARRYLAKPDDGAEQRLADLRRRLEGGSR